MIALSKYNNLYTILAKWSIGEVICQSDAGVAKCFKAYTYDYFELEIIYFKGQRKNNEIMVGLFRTGIQWAANITSPLGSPFRPI